MEDVRASTHKMTFEEEQAEVAKERHTAAVMRRRPKPVPASEFNPGGGEYLLALPDGPAGSG